MKYILTFIGGVAVGVLTAIGICSAEEGGKPIPGGGNNGSAAISADVAEDLHEDDAGEQASLLFRDFSDLR